MISGDIHAQGVPAAFAMLGQAQGDGVLILRGELADARVAFQGGGIVHATSSRVPRLGEILTKQGVLSAAQLDAALWVQRQDPEWKFLGTVFREVELVTREQLEAALETQIASVLADVYGWTRGRFRFEAAEHDWSQVTLPVCRQVAKYELRIAMQAHADLTSE